MIKPADRDPSGFQKRSVPHAAVEEQREALVHDAIENMKAQGINLPNDSIPANAMLDQAEQRVRLGLQISAIVEKEKITSFGSS